MAKCIATTSVVKLRHDARKICLICTQHTLAKVQRPRHCHFVRPFISWVAFCPGVFSVWHFVPWHYVRDSFLVICGTEWRPTLCRSVVKKLLTHSLTHSVNGRFVDAVGPGDECTETTCSNGGVCVQHWHSWLCNCDQTSFTGPTCDDGR